MVTVESVQATMAEVAASAPPMSKTQALKIAKILSTVLGEQKAS